MCGVMADQENRRRVAIWKAKHWRLSRRTGLALGQDALCAIDEFRLERVGDFGGEGDGFGGSAEAEELGGSGLSDDQIEPAAVVGGDREERAGHAHAGIEEFDPVSGGVGGGFGAEGNADSGGMIWVKLS